MQKNNKNESIQNSIKICHIILMLTTHGGAEKMLMLLLLANPDSARNKMVVVLGEAGDWGDQLRSAGVIVHELGMQSFLEVPRIFFSLKKIISEFKPDIVQTWMYHSDFLGGLAAYFAGCKNIMWGIHRTSLSWKDSKNTILIMKLSSLISRWIPKKIIPVAEAGRKAHEASGYDPKKMQVIPNGFDFSKLVATPQQRADFRKACTFSDDDLVIGCLGRFHPVKGQDNFVKAAGVVIKHNANPNIKFLMVGKDCDEDNVELMGWISDHNLKDRVILLGERSDVATCLSGMDIFCMPSRNEGFPLCLGEAMAMALPCVATDVGDTGVLAGGAATLVPPQDENALAQSLLDIINLPKEQRLAMGQRGKARVFAEYSIEKISERYDEVYRELAFGN